MYSEIFESYHLIRSTIFKINSCSRKHEDKEKNFLFNRNTLLHKEHHTSVKDLTLRFQVTLFQIFN